MKEGVNALLMCNVAVGKAHLQPSAEWGGPPGADGRPIYMPWCTCGNPMKCSCPWPDGVAPGTDPRKTAPPDGCDSVVAQPDRANAVAVNYDGVAVYRNDAILPRYLVVYQYKDKASVVA